MQSQNIIIIIFILSIISLYQSTYMLPCSLNSVQVFWLLHLIKKEKPMKIDINIEKQFENFNKWTSVLLSIVDLILLLLRLKSYHKWSHFLPLILAISTSIWLTDKLFRKNGYFSNPPKKLCNNFFGVHRTSFWSN